MNELGNIKTTWRRELEYCLESSGDKFDDLIIGDNQRDLDDIFYSDETNEKFLAWSDRYVYYSDSSQSWAISISFVPRNPPIKEPK